MMTDHRYQLDQWGHHIPGPFESPIEETFAESALKYFRPSLEVQKQVEVQTQVGRFRLDFLISSEKERVAIECDGREYHRFRQDLWRDAAILSEKHVDKIYRLSGEGIYYHLEDCIYIMSQWDPQLFSKKGFHAISRVCSEDVLQQLEEDRMSAWLW